MKQLLILFLLLTTAATAQIPYRGRKVALVSPPGASTAIVTVTVTFASAPTSPTATFAALKYGKDASLQFDVDDNLPPARDLFALFQGGTASNGTTYPGLKFSDGTGALVSYRAGLAVNARGNFNNNDQWVTTGRVTASEVNSYLTADWSVMNHGYYHEPTGNFFYGPTSTASSAGNNLVANVKYSYDKLTPLGSEYIMRTVVVPSSHPAFVQAADSLNLLGVTTTGATQAMDGRTGYPTNTGLNTANAGGNFAQEETMPTGFVVLKRVFQDSWTGANLATHKAQVDDLLAKSSATKHLTLRIGTHTAPFVGGMLDFFAHVDSVAANRLWVVGMHEYMEYREVKRLAVKSQSVAGNVLTLTLDLSAIPAVNRYRDMSLLVTGGTVTGVSVAGADSFTANNATGLINIFKRKLTGFPVPQ